MNNQEIAQLLRKVAAAYQIRGANRFKIIAYEKAADSIEHLTSEVKDLWDDGKLNEVPGVGASIASHLDELFRTGKVRHFEEVMQRLPKAMFPLLSIAGFGAKRAYKLVTFLKLKSPGTVVEDLEAAAKKGKIAPMEGFGEKSQQVIVEAIESFKKGQTKERRMVLPYADAIAQEAIIYLKRCSEVIRVDPLGSLRRMVATIGDIDIAVATRRPDVPMDWFLNFPKIKKIIEKGPAGTSVILENGKQIDLRVQRPEAYGAMLQYFTGSKHHNIHLRELALKKDFSLSEYGIKSKKKIKDLKSLENYNGRLKIFEFADEKSFYQFIGLPWIPPELREDRGEIEAAQERNLPNLVKLGDIKGDFHSHSSFDLEPSHDVGANTIEEMLEKAQELGYQYFTFSEHNPSITNHKKSQIIDRMKRRNEKIEQIKLSNKNVRTINVINSLEIDLLPSGNLALPEEAFDFIDFAIVAVHSSFNLSREKMTERIIHGLSHPKVRILAHPTGRLLNEREGYELDWEAIFDFCKIHKKTLEINCHPARLDLPDVLVREAIKEGVKITLGSDAHSIEAMDMMQYGVSVARRGWCEKDDILNTLSYNKVIKWLRGGEKK